MADPLQEHRILPDEAACDAEGHPTDVNWSREAQQEGEGVEDAQPFLKIETDAARVEEESPERHGPELDSKASSADREGSEGGLVSEINAPKITLELLSQRGFYDMPLAKAARILGRTEGSFQRVCRGLGILRWPYRVRKSLQAIMAKTEQYLDDSSQEDGMSKAEVLRVLQAHMDDIKGISGIGMDKATKQYRQYIFKLNHKLARKSAKQGPGISPAPGAFKAKGMLRAASRIQKSQQGMAASASQRIREQPGERPSSDAAEGRPRRAERALPMRPTPRHFKDLPINLALPPTHEGAGVDIIGTMAMSANQSRMQSSSPPPALLPVSVQEQQKQEFLELCAQMHVRMSAEEAGIQARGPALSRDAHALPPTSISMQQLLDASLRLQQPLVLPAGVSQGYLMHPTGPTQ